MDFFLYSVLFVWFLFFFCVGVWGRGGEGGGSRGGGEGEEVLREGGGCGYSIQNVTTLGPVVFIALEIACFILYVVPF